jgi:hypothetical protein
MNKRILLSCVFSLLLPVLPLVSADRVADASSGKSPPSGDLVLFPLDDYSIPWRENLKLTLEAPQKYPGNPVMKAGPIEGVDGYGTLLYGTVMKQGGKFRMWYLASPRADSRIPGDVERNILTGAYRPVAYAESTDGIHWVRPNLGLVEFRGNKNNNLVLIEPSNEPYANPYDFVAVFYEPEDPNPNQRYKMAYITRDIPKDAASTATAVSPDGIRWKLVNTAMFTKGNFENTSLIKFDGLYYLAGQDIPPADAGLPDGSPAGRVMKIFFSPDFRHWSNGRTLAFYRNGYQPEPTNFGQENHMGAGLWHRGNVILGFYGRWYGDTIITNPKTPMSPLKGLKMDLGLAVSNDAIHYREPVRDFIMVHHGAADDWDSEAILEANAFANTETETYIWYSHWYTSRPNRIPALPQQLSETMIHKADSIGLLTMPRDRFGYFSKLLAVSRERRNEHDVKLEASCLTRSMTPSHASQLFANVDEVRPRGALQIAVVDDAERPLAGYTSELSSSSLKARVEWAGKQASLPVGKPFRIKVTWPVGVNNAKLYALYIEQQ